MNFRLGTLNDCSLLTALRLDMRRERDNDFYKDSLEQNTFDFFTRNIASGNHVAFVCEENGRVIATAGLTLFEMPPTPKLLNGKVAKLMNMYTIPEYRNKGIAGNMLQFVLEYAKAHCYYKLMLNSSPMGKKLYQNAGFTLLDNEYEYYINN